MVTVAMFVVWKRWRQFASTLPAKQTPTLSQDGRRCDPLRESTFLAVRGGGSVHDAGAIIDLMEEGGAEEAEIIEGHAHILSHPMRGEDAGGVQTLEASSRGRRGEGDLRSSAPPETQRSTYLRSPGAPVQTVPIRMGVTVVLVMSVAVVTVMLVVGVAVVMVVVGVTVVVMLVVLDGDGPDVAQAHVLKEACEAAQGEGAVFSVPTGAKGQRSGPERADER